MSEQGENQMGEAEVGTDPRNRREPREAARGSGSSRDDPAPPVDPPPGPGRYGPALRAVALATVAVAYLEVVLGDTVRVTQSGMGCRSWPLCNGHLGLVGNLHALLEQSHRYMAAIVTILVVSTFVLARRHARRDRLVYRGAALGLALIALQVALGALTVLAHNAGWTVALHLTGAWLLVGTATLTAIGAWQGPQSLRRPGPAGAAGLVAVASLLVLAVSGMLVLHGGASRACPAWPVCAGGVGPPGLVALQYLHRSLALVASVAIAVAAVRAWRSPALRPTSRVLASGVLGLLCGTVGAGALVATTGAPAVWQDLHLVLASALWVATVALATPHVRARPGTPEAATAAAASPGASRSVGTDRAR